MKKGPSTYSAEDLTYTVTFDGSGAANPSYTVSYAEGTYKTYFTSKILSKDEIEKITFDRPAAPKAQHAASVNAAMLNDFFIKEHLVFYLLDRL